VGYQIRNSASLLGPQIDVRAAGGYVVGAGSAVSGRRYEVIDRRPPAALPVWVTRMLTRRSGTPLRPQAVTVAPGRLAGLVRTVEAAQPGQRNDALYWAACRAAELNGADHGAVTKALVAAALTAGLPEREARRTIASALGGGR
jgi:hypothetical protein